MNNLIKHLLVIATILTLSGCGKPTTLDCSSDEALDKSLDAMTDELSEKDGLKFAAAVAAITIARGNSEEKVKKAICGKTAKEIIQMAEKEKK